MKKKLLILASAFLAMLFALPAYSVNLRFLAFSPVRFFNDRDWALLEKTSDDLLENASDGETRDWKNPKTGHRGTMKALRTYKNSEGETCRDVQFANFARDMSGTVPLAPLQTA